MKALGIDMAVRPQSMSFEAQSGLRGRRRDGFTAAKGGTRSGLSKLAYPAKAGAEKIITKNGKRLLIEDARRGLADIEAGRTQEADPAIARLQHRRAETAGKAAKKRG